MKAANIFDHIWAIVYANLSLSYHLQSYSIQRQDDEPKKCQDGPYPKDNCNDDPPKDFMMTPHLGPASDPSGQSGPLAGRQVTT